MMSPVLCKEYILYLKASSQKCFVINWSRGRTMARPLLPHMGRLCPHREVILLVR